MTPLWVRADSKVPAIMTTNKSNNNNNNSRKASFTRIRQIGGVSDRQRVNLRYTQLIGITNVVTTGSFDNVFRGNSVFDPDFSGAGGQPANFDDYAALYNQYRVWGSSIEVQPLTTMSGTEPMMWAIGPRHISTGVTASTQMDFAAQPYVKTRLTSIYRTGAPDSVFSLSMSTAKFQGLSDTEFQGRDDLTSLVSTNPAEQWYWHVNVCNVDTSITAEIAVYIKITYDVEFFDRVDTTLDFYGKLTRMNGIVGHLRNRIGRSSGISKARLLAPEGKSGQWSLPPPPDYSALRKTTVHVDEDSDAEPGAIGILVEHPAPPPSVRDAVSTRKRMV